MPRVLLLWPLENNASRSKTRRSAFIAVLTAYLNIPGDTMQKTFRTLLTLSFVFTLTAVAVVAQKKAPDYKIAAINITPFNEATGKFEDVLTTTDTRSFFNDLSMSLFVTVEIAGEAGSFEAGRKVVISVTEGRKAKFNKTEQVGLIGEGGRYYIPVWLYGSMCSDVTIKARLVGQKTTSPVTRKVTFECGE
jgi:hypothetical protein